MSRKKASQLVEEEDEYEYEEVEQGDQKDQIIAKQKRMIEEMQKEFTDTLDALRTQFNDFVEESTEIQDEMLERIKELKEELADARKKQSKYIETAKGSKAVVRSSLYTSGPKHPRKLAQSTKKVNFH